MTTCISRRPTAARTRKSGQLRRTARAGGKSPRRGSPGSRHFAVIHVRNVPAVVHAGSDMTINEGDVTPFVGTFTAVEYPDKHEATWDWGDSQTPTAGVVTETNTPPVSTSTFRATTTLCHSSVRPVPTWTHQSLRFCSLFRDLAPRCVV